MIALFFSIGILALLTIVLIATSVKLASASLPNITARVGFIKDVASAIQAFLTTAGILAAAWWFLANRQGEPRIKIEHIVSQRAAKNDKTLLGIEVRVTNVGNVRVDLAAGKIKLFDVNPLEKVLQEESSDASVLEPGEPEQIYFRKIMISSVTKTVQVTTELDTPEKGFKWSFRSLFDIDNKQSSSVTTSSTHSTPISQEAPILK